VKLEIISLLLIVANVRSYLDFLWKSVKYLAVQNLSSHESWGYLIREE